MFTSLGVKKILLFAASFNLTECSKASASAYVLVSTGINYRNKLVLIVKDWENVYLKDLHNFVNKHESVTFRRFIYPFMKLTISYKVNELISTTVCPYK